VIFCVFTRLDPRRERREARAGGSGRTAADRRPQRPTRAARRPDGRRADERYSQKRFEGVGLLTQKSPNLGERKPATPTRRSRGDRRVHTTGSLPGRLPGPLLGEHNQHIGSHIGPLIARGVSVRSDGSASSTPMHLRSRQHRSRSVLVSAAVTQSRGHGTLTAHSWPTALPEPPLVRPASVGDNRAERGRQGNRNEVKGGSTSPTAAAVGTLAGTHIGTYATGGLGVHGLRCISVKAANSWGSGLLLTPSLPLGCRQGPTKACPDLRGTVLHLEACRWS
jgi:hypothetical protein